MANDLFHILKYQYKKNCCQCAEQDKIQIMTEFNANNNRISGVKT